ncbi:T9SS type A sorting domain-containing protein [Larkinella insperata]|uniref:T9SS type A sorting domain-containing protein n=1 Tax=Larkinella insperata TaxID=332158 RepID=A0ABW3Q9A5_9BACT|nr:T9SS type A sorting domain-containing protein [Larkinella insperata]
MHCRSLLFAGLVALLSCTYSLGQDLDFNTTAPLYPDGATSHSYVSIGTPAVNVDISITGPGLFSNLSPRRAGTGLNTPSVNFNSVSETKNYSFTFGDPVMGLEFSLLALQYKTDFTNKDHNYQDKIIILATDEAGNTVMPVIPAGAGYSVNGNEILATSSTRSDVNKVRFPDKVKNVTIVYGNGPLAGPDPNPQGFTIGDMEWAGVVLPVELANFRAKPIRSVIQLLWETTSERNASHFIVEHSLDVTEFTPIGRVTAFGDVSRRQLYSFVDDQSHQTTNYYRLQQVDKDGTRHYSKIIAVRHDERLSALSVYPNPADGRSIGVQMNEIEPSALRLTDLSGYPIDFRVIQKNTGQITLEPSAPLKSGFYLLHAKGHESVRILVK